MKNRNEEELSSALSARVHPLFKFKVRDLASRK